jgi:hypothetical protein
MCADVAITARHILRYKVDGEAGWFPVPEEKRKSLDPAENRTMLPRLSSPLPCRSPHHDNPTHVVTQYAVIQLRSFTGYILHLSKIRM